MFNTHKILTTLVSISSLPLFALLSSCGAGGGQYSGQGAHRMGPLPDPAVRAAEIAQEDRGNFYYGRRYHVQKTRFWGYLRKPGTSFEQTGKLVIMNEDAKHQPDRFSENGSGNQRYAFDNNYEYKIFGSYTGRKAYDPNSNLFLPEFRLTGYQLVNTKPGWVFSPNDYYDPYKVTLRTH